MPKGIESYMTEGKREVAEKYVEKKRKNKKPYPKMLGAGMARKAAGALLKRKSRMEELEAQLEGKSF